MNKKSFGTLSSGEQTTLYTISSGKVSAEITDYGATLVRLWAPDKEGNLADVILGYDDAKGYEEGTTFQGAIVGRNANRIAGASFAIGGVTHTLTPNEGENNLHSGPDFFSKRMWTVEEVTDNSIRLYLYSPNGDQGYPGNARIRVTYTVEDNGLTITYDCICDMDTVFNLTNHSYFNLAGHDHPEKAMEQELIMPARVYTVADDKSIPTGEMRSVEGTPMDFRIAKVIGRDHDMDYEALNLQGGYDHNFEVFCDPCAILSDPASGRTMAVSTDRPGIQFYAGNYIVEEKGKNGAIYTKRSAVCLETQCYPDSVNHPEWVQPITKAGEKFHSVTRYAFK